MKSGATLGGTGTTGTVTVESGGILAPGDGPGILHSGSVTLAAGAHFAVGLGGATPGNGGYDQLAAGGKVTLGGATLDVSFVNGFHPLTGEKFDILGSDSPITGKFAELPQGKKFHADGVTWKINYHAGDGHDVVLKALLAGVKIVIATPGPHLIDATHTVAGQPLPTNYGDLIICQNGNNTVHAGKGPDMIVAGPGRDVLFGSGGADTFLFRNDNTDAHIHHFVHGVDKLELAKSVFISAAHIHYDVATGALIFDSGNPWGRPVQFATLAPHLHLTDGDLLFV